MAQLPEELLQHICSHLLKSGHGAGHPRDEKESLATLASFSRANKTCNRVALAQLYSVLDIRHGRAFRLRSFLNTLVRRPSTVDLVLELCTDPFMTENADATALSEHLPEHFNAAIDGLSVSKELKGRLKSGIMKGVQDAEIALILCLCRNLQRWETVAVHGIDQTLCMAVVHEGLATNYPWQLAPLQKLNAVKISHWDTEGAAMMPEVQPLLQLPAMTTFRGHMIRCDESSVATSSIASQIKRLYFEDSLLDSRGIESLLSTGPQLETLSVHWGSSIIGTANIDYVAIGAALRRHAKSLKNLTLKPKEASMHGAPPGPLGSLMALESLLMLSVPCSVLLGDATSLEDDRWLAERLPATLRTLRIMDAEDNEAELLDAQLVPLMSDERFADLTTIRVNRGEEFTMDVSDIGWDESSSNRFWVVLKRIS